MLSRRITMQTLEDYIEDGLEILSIGLNPSPPSVEASVYFAGKRNRFWKALNASGLIDEELEPTPLSMQRLFKRYKMGFTDTVKRPTPGAGGLRKADFVRDVPILQRQIVRYQPQIAWFHGKVAFKQFVAVTKMQIPEIEWGLQDALIGSSRIYLSPNPSPANAAFSLQDLIENYQELQRIRQNNR